MFHVVVHQYEPPSHTFVTLHPRTIFPQGGYLEETGKNGVCACVCVHVYVHSEKFKNAV